MENLIIPNHSIIQTMIINRILSSLQDTKLGVAVRESTWLFPTVECLHVLAITLVVGSIVMMDLRLLGVSSRKLTVAHMANEVLPWTRASFVAAVLTGGTLFTSNAVKYAANTPFQIKMLLIVLAGINMLVFHLIIYRKVHRWNENPRTPFYAKLAGGVSLLCWVGVVSCGRWIGFTT